MDNKNIVIAVTDVEALSRTLSDIAEWIKKLGQRARVTLLYVADAEVESAAPVLEDIKIKELRLSALAEKFEELGVEATLKLKVGAPAREIVGEAKESGAFAILASTDARAGTIFGSATEEVIKRAPCPVIVFKPKLLKFTEKIALNLSSRIKRIATLGIFEKRGKSLAVKEAGEVREVKPEPEAVFSAEAKYPAHAPHVHHPEPRQKELRFAAAYGAAALVLYAAIFQFSSAMESITLQKNFLSVALVLGIALAAAYTYGNTISHALKYRGL